MYSQLGVDVDSLLAEAEAGSWHLDSQWVYPWPCRTITWSLDLAGTGAIAVPDHIDPVLAVETALTELTHAGGPSFQWSAGAQADLAFVFYGDSEFRDRNPTLANAGAVTKALGEPSFSTFGPFVWEAGYTGTQPWTIDTRMIDINSQAVFATGHRRYSQVKFTNLMLHEAMHTVGLRHNPSKESLLHATTNTDAHYSEMSAGDRAAVSLMSSELCNAIGIPTEPAQTGGPAPMGYSDTWVQETITHAVNRGALTAQETALLTRAFTWGDSSDSVDELAYFLGDPWHTNGVYDFTHWYNHARALRWFSIATDPTITNVPTATAPDGHLRIEGIDKALEYLAGNTYDSAVATAQTYGWDLDKNLMTIMPCRTLTWAVNDHRNDTTTSAETTITEALESITAAGGRTFTPATDTLVDLTFDVYDDGTVADPKGSGTSDWDETLRYDSAYAGPTVRTLTGTQNVTVDTTADDVALAVAWDVAYLLTSFSQNYFYYEEEAFNAGDKAMLELFNTAICSSLATHQNIGVPGGGYLERTLPEEVRKSLIDLLMEKIAATEGTPEYEEIAARYYETLDTKKNWDFVEAVHVCDLLDGVLMEIGADLPADRSCGGRRN